MWTIIGAGVIGIVAFYLYKVYLPGKLEHPDVDLEELAKEAIEDKQAIAEVQKKVHAESASMLKEINTIVNAGAKDHVETELKKQEVTKDPKSVKEFLESEGFNVEEIYPE